MGGSIIQVRGIEKPTVPTTARQKTFNSLTYHFKFVFDKCSFLFSPQLGELESGRREERASRARDGDAKQIRINNLQEENRKLQVRRGEKSFG